MNSEGLLWVLGWTGARIDRLGSDQGAAHSARALRTFGSAVPMHPHIYVFQVDTCRPIISWGLCFGLLVGAIVLLSSINNLNLASVYLEGLQPKYTKQCIYGLNWVSGCAQCSRRCAECEVSSARKGMAADIVLLDNAAAIQHPESPWGGGTLFSLPFWLPRRP